MILADIRGLSLFWSCACVIFLALQEYLLFVVFQFLLIFPITIASSQPRSSFGKPLAMFRHLLSQNSMAEPIVSRETVPDILNQGQILAPDGEYDILAVVGSGYVSKERRPQDYRYCVRFADTLVHPSKVRFDGTIPIGLPDNWEDLVDQEKPEHLTRSEFQNQCRYCGLATSTKSNQNRHEKRCPSVGGPGHDCVKSKCPSNCPGPSEWTRPIDKRFGNPKTGRPKK